MKKFEYCQIKLKIRKEFKAQTDIATRRSESSKRIKNFNPKQTMN